MKQSQIENERLLSEFRSQKKEVEELRADRNRLLQQQAETEKLAARLQSQLNSRSGGSLADRRPSYSDPTRVAQDTRDRLSRPSSPTPVDPQNSSTPRSSDTLNWRPIRKPAP